MEKVKVENYRRENPDKDFLDYKNVSDKKCLYIRNSLYKKLKESNLEDNLALVKAIDSYQIPFDGVNTNNPEFNLQNLFMALKISPPEKTYINWYRYDDIDEVELSDLENYFYDLWYPDLDDIDIFDESFLWVISISHNGEIKYVKFYDI